MRFISIAALVGMVAAAVGQDQGPRYKGPGPRPPEACDMKKVETAPFCDTCGGLLDDKQKEDHKAKEYAAHKIRQAKCCVKKFYYAECHADNSHFDKGECCGKAKVEKLDRSALYWICEGCGTRVDSEGKKCPIDDCPKKKLRAECTSQPTFPHCNEKWWREEQKKKEKKK